MTLNQSIIDKGFCPFTKISADKWEDHFNDIFKKESAIISDVIPFCSDILDWLSVSIAEVKDLIAQLKPGKSSGSDYIPSIHKEKQRLVGPS